MTTSTEAIRGTDRKGSATRGANDRPTEVAAFRNVSKAFGSVKAVNGSSFTLHPGETVAFLGPNGAGKSTSIDMLLGLKDPSAGEVSLFGGSPRQAIMDGRVGVMLQSGGLLPEVTVRELVTFACKVHPRGYAVDDVLTTAQILDLADRKVDKLSGGQEQRVRFALATAGDSDLIVLDEPTTGMDVTARQAFWSVMKAQADAGRTILFATHYLEEADAIADRVLVMHKGRLIADGTAAEIKARAGQRRISFDLHPGDGGDASLLSALPGITALDVSGSTVRISTSDADATMAAVYRAGLYPRGLEVTGVGLEQAFITITAEAAGTEAN
ncbi:ABC transporter ATP-binding protein [Streptacidiphilus jiangxiensis]|uniref:ABC-2 type transport system ATP-binding protein n=1 Tax=Streptacidiphilus jiangxiensis TaxID=235985 RepID=A0A1H7FV78_STRJI|nr:ABC transporter ATP-binding protein [Streptacidiphilus jiangxiensis]SEK28402.1 ABC-2 type transport system ATP-binding protein [Streptacidiphilus jiangxiensis]